MNRSETFFDRARRMVAQHRWLAPAAIGLIILGSVLALTHRRSAEAGATAPASTEAGEEIDSVLTLDSASLALAELEYAAVGTTGGGALIANGTITFDANRVSVVAPRADGRVVNVQADLGATVRAGDVVATLESREVGQIRGDLQRARAALDVAQNNFEREQRLYAQAISSQKEMLEAQAAYKTALAEYSSAASQISGLGATAGEGGIYALTTPVSGTVVERNAMPGQIAGPSTNLFTIADLTRVWIAVDVYEADAARVRRGAPAIISARGFPADTFRGRVTYAGGVVDTTSRTFKVRVEADNAGQRLRPGMYAQVRIEAAAGPSVGAGGPLVVPDLALQDLNGKSVVFVRRSAPGQFVARAVAIGPRVPGGFVTITDGLRLGETIVARGAFQLRAQLLKGTFGDDER